MKIAIALIILVAILLVGGLCKVSGDCSRREAEREFATDTNVGSKEVE